VHNMCFVRPALLCLNVHVLKVFYEQINYYYLLFAPLGVLDVVDFKGLYCDFYMLYLQNSDTTSALDFLGAN